MSRLAVTLLARMGALSGSVATQSGGSATVPYPEGFRSWAHVKSALISERHPDFARSGGFRHIYANPEALAGYRTGTFPEGSIIVVDWVEGQDANGSFTEAARTRVDVMVKDKTRYAATKGWGFERFNGNSQTERMVTAADSQCVACHSGPNAKDLVFSKLRP
jgi:hypothetical protein